MNDDPSILWDVFSGPEHLGSIKTALSTDSEEALELALAIWPERAPLRVAKRLPE